MRDRCQATALGRARYRPRGELLALRLGAAAAASLLTASLGDVLHDRVVDVRVSDNNAATSVTETNRDGRALGERGAPARDDPPRTRVLGWPEQPVRLSSDYAGVLLLLPALVVLDLPGAVAAARFPGTREVPALSSVLSLLALKDDM